MNDYDAIRNNWLTETQKHWDIWIDFGKRAMTGTTATRSSASDLSTDALFNGWPSMFAMTPPAAAQEFFLRLLGFSQSYFRMADQFLGGAAHYRDLPMGQWFEGMATPFQSRDRLAVWDLPLDTWRRTMSSMLPLPGDFLQAAQTEDMARVPPQLREHIDRFLAIPAVGYSREALEQYQKLTRLMVDYLRALTDYNFALMHVGARSTERFTKKIAEQDAPIDSLRKIYDLWVDAFEEGYAEFAMSSEHAVLFGRMVNALIAVKHQGSLLVDETLEAMNMPTRREINTMHLRVHEARRANYTLRAELELIRDRLDTYDHALNEREAAGTNR